jgi:hypothetical protein
LKLSVISTHQPEPVDASIHTSEKPRFVNFYIEGKQRIPIPPETMLAELVKHTGGWPKCIGGRLAVRSSKSTIEYYGNRDEVLAWLFSHFDVEWTPGKGITKPEFFAYLLQNTEQYGEISEFPHHPPIEGIYYNHKPVESSNGLKLNGLLDFFRPATDLDRELIKAFCMTLFWGGPPGQRPAFVITTNDHGTGKGIGFGKTTLVNTLSKLVGGKMVKDHNDNMENFKKRIINNHAPFRLIVLDNLKSLRFSSSDFESLITGDEISSRVLFSVNKSIDNLFTVAITVNGVHLSKDMAQRSVLIELAQPEHTHNWHAQLNEYIEANRWEIIGDILGLLRSEGEAMQPGEATRWGAWEKGVLSKVTAPNEVRALVKTRMASADDDVENAGQFLAQLNEEAILSRYKECPLGVFHIPHPVMSEQLSLFLGRSIGRNSVRKQVDLMGLDCIHQVATSGHARIWLVRKNGEPITPQLILTATQTFKPVDDGDNHAEETEPVEADEATEAI